MIVLWCNGSTADFGSVSLDLNPSRTTKINNNIMFELTIKEKELIRDIIWDFLNDKLKRENYKNNTNELSDIMTKLTYMMEEN